jgi:hypothetical protein
MTTHTITAAIVAQLYADEVARLKAAPGTAPRGVEATACQGTRTRVHEALQAQVPPPTAASSDMAPEVLASLPMSAQALLTSTDPDVLHAVQKSHFTALWVETDRLMVAAGITERG